MGSFGTASLAIFLGMFGGITLFLFLICYCCQRKLMARTMNMADITDVEHGRRHSTNHRQAASRQQRRSDAHQLIPSMVAPPPDYNTVVKKEDTALPTYDDAVAKLESKAGLESNGHI